MGRITRNNPITPSDPNCLHKKWTFGSGAIGDDVFYHCRECGKAQFFSPKEKQKAKVNDQQFGCYIKGEWKETD